MDWDRRTKDIRRTLNITQEVLAERLGVDSSTIRRWELGLTDPHRRHKVALLALVSLTPVILSRP